MLLKIGIQEVDNMYFYFIVFVITKPDGENKETIR